LSIRPEPEKLIVLSNPLLGETEWTFIRMHDSPLYVESSWRN
jgi:hypothetical protein